MSRLSVVLFVAACGSSPGQPAVDAAPPDADAPAPDAPPAVGPITVTVKDYALAPVVGADVVFADATGAPYAHVTTDAAGTVSHPVTAGDSVTIIQNQDTDHQLDTILGVQPGDAIALGFLASASDGKSITVKVPSKYTGANRDDISVGGGDLDIGAATSGTTTLFPTAYTASSTFDAVAIARAGVDELPIAFTYVARTPVPAGTSATVALPAWRTDFGALAGTVANAPAGATIAWAASYGYDGDAHFDYEETYPALAGGAGSFSLPYVPGLATTHSVFLRAGVPVSAPNTNAIVSAWRVDAGSTPPAFAVDFAAGLPALTAGAVAVPTGATTPQLAWTATASEAAGVGGSATIAWTDAAQTDQWTQRVVFPAATASPLQLPRLPDDLAQHRLAPGATFTDVAIAFVAADDLTAQAFRESEAARSGVGRGPHTEYASTIEVTP